MQRRLFLLSFLVLIGLAVFANQAMADITINYGTNEGGTLYIDLQAETANQVVHLFATGIVADGGSDFMELDVQVGDGGSVLGGTDTTPVISSIDLITGTIWASASPIQSDPSVNQLIRQSTVETGSLVSADGLIGTIVFNTTGFGTGEIDFRLSGIVVEGDTFSTNFLQGTSQLTTIAPNGIIRVTAVPEPSTPMFLVGGLVGLVVRRRRLT